MKSISAAIWFVVGLGISPVWSQGIEPAPWPQAQPEWQAASFVRTTLRVKSIEESLKLYRDILGFQVYYAPRPGPLGAFGAWLGYEPTDQVKYVVVRSEMKGEADPMLGQIGFAEITTSSGDQAAFPGGPTIYGGLASMWLMASVDNTMEVYERVKTLGYQIDQAPQQKADGTYSSLYMRGPDNERIYVSQELVRALLVQPKTVN